MQPWEHLTDIVLTRPGMYVGRETYERVCSFVEGFGTAHDDGVLDGFRMWLAEATVDGRSSLAWSVLLLDEIFPGRHEASLQQPGGERRAIDHLRNRLVEYLTSREASGSQACTAS
ncbi:hypothetical protein [Oerskovia enterophila]|uniref:hypothetical protein n=1 Tax=Oerskovia enterophila TaxID=43678 RepID=UPI00339B87AB